jgi:hypothetical protein
MSVPPPLHNNVAPVPYVNDNRELKEPFLYEFKFK